ncbi:dTDP-glucose 4,6-dehydratase [Methanoculleus horonobensis]|uniref:dTDP-glucose 4,6-dehydratase n=1 Tax=Methanoculleus horonobensis TaxID=528314 RepID=UPI00082A7A07|nr:dTDP-glucose 4,6-dehydratase [Methanoculleus horonobensis]
MRLLVTGGAGFIGCNFVRMLVERYPADELVVLDKLTYAGRLENLQDLRERITFIHGDICNRDDLRQVGDCDAVINFAAETHVDRSITDAATFVKTDVLGTCTLLDYCLNSDVNRFLQVSTDEVYGSVASGASRETASFNPSSPYSASKAGAELLAKAYHTTYGLPVLITRSSNNFGPYQYPEKLIPVLILQAYQNRSLPIYGDGSNMRDWLFVQDNCEAIDLVLRKGKPGEAYNIGAGNERTNLEIATRILTALQRPPDLVQYVGDRPGHDFRYAVDTNKILEIGWKPSYAFEDALDLTVAWYLENEWWWRPLYGGL